MTVDEIELYNPVVLEHPVEARQHDRYRPIYLIKGEGHFQTWPDFPGQIVKYGKYYLRWIIGSQSGYHANPRIDVSMQVSNDGLIWYSFYENWHKRSYRWSSYDSKKKYREDWFKPDELEAAVDEVRTEYEKLRTRHLAKIRREKRKAEAKELGISLDELKAKRSKERKKNLETKKKRKTATKLPKHTNKKMTVAMALKDLRDAMSKLQEKLEEPNTVLRLDYVDSRIHKLHEVQRILEGWSKEKKV